MPLFNFKEFIMTKNEALIVMELGGGRVAHCSFSDTEWMEIGGSGYVFEDGCTCVESRFWCTRTDSAWETGWREVNK